ncbi:XVIPCD domain-containing protein [Pseudomonas sp. CGJS7]|uniref:XVIPCD domain-containing protein n=1 Tax=Pseudomonas sp. CGJS7 TaxID=3109348 RepID=UPI0030090174
MTTGNQQYAEAIQLNDLAASQRTSTCVYLFGAQGEPKDPAHKRAQVNTAVAAHIPVETSFQQLAALNQSQSAAQNSQSQEQTRTQSARVA